ncbi:MAG: hypothetical protein H0W50_11025 [Parachlamydiaceae bacterium]|nr:hypothetical protein [Parachlamydiaceae bacterium]
MKLFVTDIKVYSKKVILLTAACFMLNFQGIAISSNFELLTTLDEHRDLLKNCLNDAGERVIIVSPYISSRAINDDKILDIIDNKQQNGCTVTVYTDYKLDRQYGKEQLKDNAQFGRDLLRKAYINFRILDKIHAKVLIKDDDLIVIGSFNWLSAVRDSNNNFARLEQSIVVRGEEAKSLIEKSLSGLKTVDEIKTAYSDALDIYEEAIKGDELDIANSVITLRGVLPFEQQQYCSEDFENIMNSEDLSDSKRNKKLKKLAINYLAEIKTSSLKEALKKQND